LLAPYISQQKKSLAEAPALEEFEVKLPSTITGSGSTVRIPPELMPSEEQCMEWFDIFGYQQAILLSAVAHESAINLTSDLGSDFCLCRKNV